MLISIKHAHPRWPRIFLTFGILITIIYFLFGSSDTPDRGRRPSSSWAKVHHIPGQISQWISPKSHPIDSLIDEAKILQRNLEAKRTYGVKEAAAAYRKRRGRHPPPNFDKWVEYAESKDAIIVEDFFDQVHHDINPFWAHEPRTLRDASASWEFVLSIRNGSTTIRHDNVVRWLNLWDEMITDTLHFLPDVDLAMNEMDEARLLVPWKKIDEYMQNATELRLKAFYTPRADFQDVFTTVLDPPASMEDRNLPPSGYDFAHFGAYWPHFRDTCPPEAKVSKMLDEGDLSVPPSFPLLPRDDRGGYVQNVSTARDPCMNPHLRGQHGTFIEPVSMSTSKALFPMFGGSKLPQNNEILLPAPMYWTNDEFYSGGDSLTPWEEKKDALIWRGSASGGRNKANNWTRFQRHRFVAMCNGSWVDSLHAASLSGEVPSLPQAFPFPTRNIYKLGAREDRRMSEWLDATTNAKFNHLICFPAPPENAPDCEYTGQYYSLADHITMQEQYAYKFLPDLDGNSYSGRYRGFLRSHSVPLKATIYKEWHDDRLTPWAHYVPMDNTFVDFFGIWEYFIGWPLDESSGKRVRDAKARQIAMAGAEWADKVLRREDMTIYMARAVLEYARVVDDERERLGYTADLA